MTQQMITVPLSQWIELNEENITALGTIVELQLMLLESLDTNLMLSEKLTNAQARWLGRGNTQKTN